MTSRLRAVCVYSEQSTFTPLLEYELKKTGSTMGWVLDNRNQFWDVQRHSYTPTLAEFEVLDDQATC
jgi:hypothetical protein